ncbi:WxL domain-containing protein [Levilactobacillus brevis]|uniref:WxL domain-containing protein n=1 Tax=Levilactobacillus brevis ATCC 14869 = DSM 20054 TaxID=649758 RepID=U2QQU3_LEVBR|nr:WxL domain-containing protein [Levilactobacillus brevis]ERK41107.1 hypothetical protein HMPREF0495_02495 [Levilactobacillus brevis ATCC 14869 = DSM 20054]KIO99397.1 extracellular protein [Levilactobacillus brevis]MCT3571588.1 WxL domain-containing protein [Levilactobacillus brevis]SQG81605.1 cell surface protein, CscB family [Levilactobacillus brevis]
MIQFSQKLLTLMTVAVLGAATVPVVAHASSAETQGAISFIDDDGATAPVDPVNPGTPLPDTDPNNPATGNTGTLTLDVAPKTFNFGTVAASNAAKDYVATGSQNQYLQISDKRTDTDGWQVNVKQDRTLTDTNTNYVLTGATIHLPQGTARNSLNAPTSSPDPNLVVAPSVAITNVDQPVVTAQTVKTGKAVSTLTWNAGAVKLSVPKLTAKKGSYTNNVVWTLVAHATQ